jgi:hypothetical protein
MEETVKCARYTCRKDAAVGRVYCSSDCVQLDRFGKTFPTSSVEKTMQSSIKERGGRSRPYSEGVPASPQKPEKQAAPERTPRPEEPQSSPITTQTKSVSQITPVFDERGGLMKREEPTHESAGNARNETWSTSEKFGMPIMPETEKGTALMKSNEETSETPAEDSRKQLMLLREGISQSRSLIRDCAKHTLDLMKSIGSDAERDGTLRDFRKINSVAGLAREVANLAKVELEAIKIAKDLRG